MEFRSQTFSYLTFGGASTSSFPAVLLSYSVRSAELAFSDGCHDGRYVAPFFPRFHWMRYSFLDVPSPGTKRSSRIDMAGHSLDERTYLSLARWLLVNCLRCRPKQSSERYRWFKGVSRSFARVPAVWGCHRAVEACVLRDRCASCMSLKSEVCQCVGIGCV